MRRFKGPWFAAAEAGVKRIAGGAEVGTGTVTSPVADASATLQPVATVWDQNALTPGSAFMAKLGTSLTTAGARLSAQLKVPITVSTTSEPGEGEHKLLKAMRTAHPASCMIYGLDADLILLAMLLGAETGATVCLLREAQEFESSKGHSIQTQEWRTLDIAGLTQVLLPDAKQGQVADFVASMSLLGNDFLPRSLTRTVRGDGIPQILAGLREWVWSVGHRIVGVDGRLSRDGLLALLGPWAAAEENDMLAVVLDAVRASRRPAGIGANPAETALKEWQATPARWCALGRLLGSNRKQLAPGWRDLYRKEWHAGSDAADYLSGVAWVWDYYAGARVDQGWSYGPHLPPLWSDVVAALSAMPAGSSVGSPTVTWPDPLPEWVHLLSVLPVDSVRRLLPPSRQGLMTAEPWWWPDSWSLFDVGRGQMWECEPVIPMIPEAVLRGQT